jgi:hypothetical protein
VSDVYDVCFRIDLEDDALESAYEMIVGAVVGCERDDWPGHRGSAFGIDWNTTIVKAHSTLTNVL